MKSTIILTFLFAMAFLTGCATGPGPAEQPTEQTVRKLEPGVYATETGEKISPEELYDRLANHRFVVVGEQHDDAWSHEVQARVLREIAARTDSVALGMEMFQRPFQAPLDAYIAGEIDEEEMLEQTEWAARWGFGTEFYSPLWRFARENAMPIVALNARRELSKAIARGGLEGLGEADRADVPELDLGIEAHRAFVRHAFEQHDMEMSEERFERFYTAQVLWDETMAATAVEFVQTHPGVDTMVIVAGGAHADKRFGIPPRLERRVETDVVTLQPVSADDASTLEQLGEAADYVWVRT